MYVVKSIFRVVSICNLARATVDVSIKELALKIKQKKKKESINQMNNLNIY